MAWDLVICAASGLIIGYCINSARLAWARLECERLRAAYAVALAFIEEKISKGEVEK